MSLKESILKVLEENRDQFVSGQELAERLNVSRAAVWKAVKKLRQEGHEIIASPNNGYRLEYLSDILSEPGIRLYLSPENKDLPIFIFDEVESTNSLAKKLAAEGAQNGSIIVAEGQSKGRGRMGRSFYSPSGTGLYMSMILSVHEDMNSALFTTIYAGVAVCRVINRFVDKEAKIKWVNDILIDGKKVCGILTESISDFESGMVETVILGIGLNIKTENFPDEIREIADSISVYHIPRNRFVAEIANEVLCLKHQSRKTVIEEYKRRSIMLGKEIEYSDKGRRRSGKVLDINDNGHLIVKEESGRVTALMYGEVVVKKAGLYKS